MPHAHMSIDGQTVLDHDLDPNNWQQRAPEQLTQLIATTNTNGRPWFKAAMMPLTEAFINGQDITINIQTHTDGWTLAVHHPADNSADTSAPGAPAAPSPTAL